MLRPSSSWDAIGYFAVFLVICHCICFCHGCLTLNDLPNSAEDPRRMTPWVAAIFKRNPSNGNWTYHCGATITESIVVITAASCVTTIETFRYQAIHDKYSDLRIVAGLLTSDYYARDKYTQESEVGMIREHRVPEAVTSSGYHQSYTRSANLAGIRLKQPFKLTSRVNKVCLVEVPNSVEELLTLAAGETGFVAGFDVQPNLLATIPQNFGGRRRRPQPNVSSSLKSFRFKLLDTVSCVRAYRAYLDVVCGQLSMDTQPEMKAPCFLEGAGLVSLTDGNRTGIGSLYLMGVYTGNSKTSRPASPYPISQPNISNGCTKEDISYFTRHGQHYRWAISHAFCSEDLLMCQSDSCRPLKELCDGTAQCHDKTDESPQVCLNQAICVEGQFRCKYGVCIDELKVCDGNNDCADGSDEDDEEKCREADIKRNVTCPPIPEAKEIESRCYLSKYLGGSSVSCTENSLPVNSRVEQTCKRYYILEEGSDIAVKTCKRTGEWSDQDAIVRCKPSCGISEAKKVGFVVGGQNVNSVGQWPWHAAIYRKVRKGFTLICGGTLISTRLVLTAAHCLTEGRITLAPENHRVVFGNLVSNFTHATTHERGHVHFQEIPIEALVVHDYYNPRSFETDIALILLKQPIQITEAVRPACFTSDEDLIQQQFDNANPQNGTKLASTVGFGYDESERVSQTLKHLELPVIPKQQCEESLATATHQHISFTWLCAGYTNGSTVCNGDSGGGLVLPLDSYGIGRKYFVQGIVSHGVNSNKGKDPSCETSTYKIFTQVSRFVPWIQSYVDKYN